jgi:hypothetical protein
MQRFASNSHSTAIAKCVFQAKNYLQIKFGDLGTTGINLIGGAGAPYYFTDRYTTDGNIVRGGLNYLFDFAAPPTPVVAKY